MVHDISQERYVYKSEYLDAPSYLTKDHYDVNFKDACNIVNGNIEIKRYFTEDRFAIKIFFIQPKNLHKKFFEGFDIEINGKRIDGNIIRSCTKLETMDSSLLNERLSFKKWYSKFTEETSAYGLTILSPKIINLPYEKFRILRVYFRSKEKTEKQYWEIKKINDERREYTFNAKDNKVYFKIPQLYEFNFNGYNSHIEKDELKIHYLNSIVKLNEFDRYERKNELATIETEEAKESSLSDHWPYGYTAPWHGITWEEYYEQFPRLLNLLKISKSFYASQNLTNYGFKNIANELFTKVKNEIYTKTTTSSDDSTKWKDYKTGTYENFIDYDYDNGYLVNSTKSQKAGLFIPYNYKGNLKTNYVLYFNDKAYSNTSSPIILNINNHQLFKRKILDHVEGTIQLKYEENNDIFDSNSTYEFKGEDIEEYLKLKDFSSIYSLDRYKVKNG
nr:hypothetical protein [Mycoplasmopsis fermentans]